MFPKNKNAYNLLVNNLIVIFIFYILYFSLDYIYPKCFGEKLGLGKAFYFTIITHSTLGFGDLTPKTNMSKAAVCLHLIFIMFLGTQFYLTIFEEIKNM